MTDRTIHSLTGATPQPGTGILHPFPTPELPHIDPFVFLDTGAPKDLGTGDIYVGPHSHRRVQPVSLLFRGRIEHRDSLGNNRTVTSGGMPWLVSGSGAVHEEVLNGDENGIFHLYSGDLDGQSGPAPMPTQVLVGHINLDPGGSITIPVPAGWTAALTVVAGAGSVHSTSLISTSLISTSLISTALVEGDTPVFNDDGDTITVASVDGAQFLLMCGKPIGEPIAMGGGFVMNTTEEINTAFDDYHSGRMGRLTPTRTADA